MTIRHVAFWVTMLLSFHLAGGQGLVLQPRDDARARDDAHRAAIQAAQGEVNRAQSALDAATARIRAAWKANPDLLQAETNVKKLQADYEQARRPVIAELMKDPAYRSAAAAASDADTTVKHEQADARSTSQPAAPTTIPVPSPEQVRAAREKLRQKTTLRDMEEKALAADPTASQAKRYLDTAHAKVGVLQAQFKAALLNDPDYKSALAQLQAAQSRLTAATGQY
jgi:outer membrane protein TolC